MRTVHRASRVGFTLVELLVVIGIIAIMIALLMPALNKARRSAQQVACQSNIRQIGMAFLTFAADHRGHLPGIQGAVGPQAEYWQGDWLGNAYDTAGNPINGDTTAYFDSIPQGGTLYKYLGQSGKTLLCPGTAVTNLDDGAGSNGKFDYQAFQLFSGVKLAKIPKHARPFWSQNAGLGSPKTYMTTTPLLGEFEKGLDPYGQVAPPTPGTNMTNGKTSYAVPRQCIFLGHPAGASFFAIDGSVFAYKRPGPSPAITALSWQVRNYGPRASTQAADVTKNFAQMAISNNGWCGFP